MQPAAARAISAVFALFWAVFFFGLIDLLVVFEQTPGFYDSYLLETGWGVLFTWLVAAPLLGLTVRPTLTALLMQIAVVGGCVAVTAQAALAWGQLVAAAGLLGSTAVVYALSAGAAQRMGADVHGEVPFRPHWPVLVVAGAAVPVGAMAATDLIAGFWQRRPPTDDITLGIDHWPMQAALAIAVPAVAGIASLRAPGWRLSLLTAATSGAWWGAVSLAYPNHAGSLGMVGGWTAIIWSAILLLASTIPARRPQMRDPADHHQQGQP